MMDIPLTRDDIKKHADALRRLEQIEAITRGSFRTGKMVSIHTAQSIDVRATFPWGEHAPGNGNERSIIRRHMDAAVAEIIDYWREQARLEANS